tara:strand:- start:1923 stop:2336 length:414 start_codon:yes stop_codon:yes gene_type:complete
MDIKPLNVDNKFDIDLGFGTAVESRLQHIMTSKGKIEVKTERDRWQTSGNFAIEISYKGNLSGLRATKADYWLHAFYDTATDEIKFCFMLPTIQLKNVIKEMINKGKVKKIMGGDNKQAELLLIPINTFVEFLQKNP